jgi:hypothetical protein
VTVTYAITGGANGGAPNNYVLANNGEVALSQQVTAKPLTVTATNVTKTYDGQAFTGSLVTYSAFADGETALNLPGTLVFGGTAQNEKNAGTYKITPSGYASGNYDYSYADGTLLINRAQRDLNNSTLSPKVYDGRSDTIGAFNPSFNQPLIAGDNVIVNVTGTLSSKDVGTRTADMGDYSYSGAGSSNYDITAPATLQQVVTAKQLNITGTALASKVYDGLKTPGTLTLGTLDGLVAPETLTFTGYVRELSDSAIGPQSAWVTYTLGDGTNGGLKDNYLLSGETLFASITPNFDSSYALQTGTIVTDATSEYLADRVRLQAVSVDFSESREIENYRMWRKKK